MTRTTSSLLTLAASLCFATAAVADPVTYAMPTSAVGCAGSAAHAEMSVRNAVPVKSVEADPIAHSVTTTFDEDEVSLASVVESLEAAGISVGEPVKLQ